MQKTLNDMRNALKAAIAAEREACAEIAETNFGVIGSTIALAIRARGEQA
jgi:hypothetical protein